MRLGSARRSGRLFSNWEVREVWRSERRKVSARRIGEGKPAVGNRLENACIRRRSKGERHSTGTVRNVSGRSYTKFLLYDYFSACRYYLTLSTSCTSGTSCKWYWHSYETFQ
nr:hypothetical protein orf18 [uncultured archaeon]